MNTPLSYRSCELIINAVTIYSAPNTNDKMQKKNLKTTPVSGTSSSDNYRSLIKGFYYTVPLADHITHLTCFSSIEVYACLRLWLLFPAVLHLLRPPLAPNCSHLFGSSFFWSNFSLSGFHVTRPTQHGCDSVHNTTSPTSAGFHWMSISDRNQQRHLPQAWAGGNYKVTRKKLKFRKKQKYTKCLLYRINPIWFVLNEIKQK